MKKFILFALFYCSVLFWGTHLLGQQQKIKTIQGRVISENKPIPDVNIRVKKSTTGTKTNAEGRFTLEAIVGDTIVFSYVGMETYELPIKGPESNLNVIMNPIASRLDEVVVKGKPRSHVNSGMTNKPESYRTIFGEEDMIRRGHSVYYVEGKNLNLAAPSLALALDKKIPGGIQRANNSLNLENGLLWEIDGIIHENPPVLDLADIKEVFVLKSLSATIKYGLQASGGVVIIKTIRGEALHNKKAKAKKITNKKIYANDAVPYYDITTNYEEALLLNKQDFTKFVESLNSDVTKHRYLAYACQVAQRHTRAIQLYRMILAISPEDPQSHRDLAQAFALNNNPQNAWNTYINHLQITGEAPTALEFHEIQNLYTSLKKKDSMAMVLFDEQEFSVMKSPVTRIVFEWADPSQEFILETVNPAGQVYQTEYRSNGEDKTSEEFFLDSSMNGEWLFNIIHSIPLESPLIIKLTIYNDWTNPKKESPKFKLFSFKKSDEDKYQLFRLKV